MTQALEPKLRPWRLGARLFSALSIFAAVVAVVGMYIGTPRDDLTIYRTAMNCAGRLGIWSLVAV